MKRWERVSGVEGMKDKGGEATKTKFTRPDEGEGDGGARKAKDEEIAKSGSDAIERGSRSKKQD